MHPSQEQVNLAVERRLTRLEILLYMVLILVAANFAGLNTFGALSLVHP